MKGEVYPFGIVGMANKGDCLQKGESVKFQLCVLGQNAQTMAYNITPLRRATVECVKDQVSGNTSGSNWIFLWVGNQSLKFFSQAGTIDIQFFFSLYLPFQWFEDHIKNWKTTWKEKNGNSSKRKVKVVLITNITGKISSEWDFQNRKTY